MWEGDFVPDVSDEENFGESEGTASILYRWKPSGVQSERKTVTGCWSFKMSVISLLNV